MESNGKLYSGSFEPNIQKIVDKYKPGLGGKIGTFKSNPQFIKNEDGILDINPGWVKTDPETQYNYVEYDPNLVGNELLYEMKLKQYFIEDFQGKYEQNRENYKSDINHHFLNLIPDEELRKQVLNSMLGNKSHEQLKLELDFESYMDLMAERVIEFYLNRKVKVEILINISKLHRQIKELNIELSKVKPITIIPT